MESHTNHPKSYRLPPIDNKALTDDSLSSVHDYRTGKNDNEINRLDIIDEETKAHIDDMKKGAYNILVAVRCRPLSNREKELSHCQTVKVMDRKMVVLMDPIEYNGPNEIFKNRSREQAYAFDFAFEQNTSQMTVFNEATKFLIEGVVNGYNATVFAYGATGAGKTYTMTGNDNNPGIMPLTLMELFDKINQYSNEREYKLKLWYLEIYNENIRDLLCLSDECLELREDPTKGITVAGITELTVTSCKDILKLLKKGNKNRTQEATGANETSSRSHAILQVLVEYKDRNSGIEIEIKYGKLSLIDLAGSERASATQNKGIRMIEGANINRSLLTLGNCINALCDASIKGTKHHVPYRDSKLTRLLKDSLGGNARTVMIANISPSINTFDDTYNTLNFANRAKNIKTFVQRNVLNAQHHITNYVSIIKQLKKEVNDLKTQLNNGTINPQMAGSMPNSNNMLIPASPNNIYQYQYRSSSNNNIGINSHMGNNNFNASFDKSVNEMKSLCEQEIALKQKVIGQQIELGKLIEQFASYHQNIKDYSTIEDPNEKLNKTDINEVNMINDTREAIDQLEKTLYHNQERLKEFPKVIDRTMTNLYDAGLRDFYFDYIQNIVKTHKTKILLIENKFLSNISKAQNDVKDEYIKELELQIKERDNYIKSKGISLPYDDLNINPNYYQGIPTNTKSIILPLEQLHNDYKAKIPKVKHTFSMARAPTGTNISNNHKMIPNSIRTNINSYTVLPPLTQQTNSNNTNNYNKIFPPRNKSPYHSNSKHKQLKDKSTLIRNYSQNLKNYNRTNSSIKEEKKYSYADNIHINRHLRQNSILLNNNNNNQNNITNVNNTSNNNNNKCSSSRSARRISLGQKINNNQNNITQIHSVEDSIMEADVEASLVVQKKLSAVLVSEANRNGFNTQLVPDKPLQMKKSDLNILLNEKRKKQMAKIVKST